MNTFKGQPITGSRQQAFSKKKPTVLNADSREAMKLIKEPPAPFKSNMTAAQMPTTEAPKVDKPKTPVHVGVKALPKLRSVGQSRPINQSGQMNGRFGTKFQNKSRPNTPSFPQKRNARFYGE
jgi:hypothetical protein